MSYQLNNQLTSKFKLTTKAHVNAHINRIVEFISCTLGVFRVPPGWGAVSHFHYGLGFTKMWNRLWHRLAAGSTRRLGCLVDYLHKATPAISNQK